jgi:exonuclease VII small subunit
MSSHYYTYPTASAPINMPQKQGYPSYPSYPTYQHGAYSRVSGSPPEAAESLTTGSGVTSYDPSAASSSYAGSASEYDASSSGHASVDLLDYMNDRLQTSFNPMPLDRSLAQQTQTSGQLNAKTRQLMELQALAQSRLAAAQANFADGIKTAKQVHRDLEWTQKRVASINKRAAQKYPEQYQMAQQRYPAQVEY